MYICNVVVGAILASPTVDLSLSSESTRADEGERTCLGCVVGAKGGGDEQNAQKILHHGDIL